MTDENSAVGVFCRLKPINSSITSCVEYKNEFCVLTVPPANNTRNKKATEFNFTGVFNEDASQEIVCNTVALPLMKKLIEGKDGLLFSYGVTGTGKTYTMVGNDINPGLIPRILKSLFNHVTINNKIRIESDNRNGYIKSDYLTIKDYDEERNYISRRSLDTTCTNYLNNVSHHIQLDKKIDDCKIFVTLVELYGDKFFDLLDPKVSKEITIKEDNGKNMYLHNAKEIEVRTAAEALVMFMDGEKNRKTAATNLNSVSSRSHMIFIVKIVRIVDESFENGVEVNQLCFADLAGSERANRTEATNQQLKEGGQINNALMILKMCIKNLRDNTDNKAVNNFFNPKSSKLTYIFKNIFEGSGLIRMIVCVQGLPEEFSETLNVLDFAETTKDIRNINNDYKRVVYVKNKDNTPHLTTLRESDLNEQLDEDNRDNITEIEDEIKKINVEVEELMSSDNNLIPNNDEICEHLMELYERYTELEYKLDDEAQKACTELIKTVDEVEIKRRCDLKDLSKLKHDYEDIELKLNDRNELYNKKLIELTASRQQNDLLKKTLKEQNNKINELNNKTQNNDNKQSQQRPSAHVLQRRNHVKDMAKKFEQGAGVPTKVLKSKQGHYNPRYKSKKSNGDRRTLKQVKNEIPIGSTVFQPNPRNSRSSKVKITNKPPSTKDLKKADEYVIQNQMVDSDLDLTTEYHKGNVIPTAGGGFAVQLYETETLRQTSPFKDWEEKNKDRSLRRSKRLNERRSKEEPVNKKHFYGIDEQ